MNILLGVICNIREIITYEQYWGYIYFYMYE